MIHLFLLILFCLSGLSSQTAFPAPAPAPAPPSPPPPPPINYDFAKLPMQLTGDPSNDATYNNPSWRAQFVLRQDAVVTIDRVTAMARLCFNYLRAPQPNPRGGNINTHVANFLMVAVLYNPVTRTCYASTLPRGALGRALQNSARQAKSDNQNLARYAMPWAQVFAGKFGIDTEDIHNYHTEDGAVWLSGQENRRLPNNGGMNGVRYPDGTLLAVWSDFGNSNLGRGFETFPCSSHRSSDPWQQGGCHDVLSYMNVDHRTRQDIDARPIFPDIQPIRGSVQQQQSVQQGNTGIVRADWIFDAQNPDIAKRGTWSDESLVEFDHEQNSDTGYQAEVRRNGIRDNFDSEDISTTNDQDVNERRGLAGDGQLVNEDASLNGAEYIEEQPSEDEPDLVGRLAKLFVRAKTSARTTTQTTRSTTAKTTSTPITSTTVAKSKSSTKLTSSEVASSSSTSTTLNAVISSKISSTSSVSTSSVTSSSLISASSSTSSHMSSSSSSTSSHTSASSASSRAVESSLPPISSMVKTSSASSSARSSESEQKSSSMQSTSSQSAKEAKNTGEASVTPKPSNSMAHSSHSVSSRLPASTGSQASADSDDADPALMPTPFTLNDDTWASITSMIDYEATISPADNLPNLTPAPSAL